MRPDAGRDQAAQDPGEPVAVVEETAAPGIQPTPAVENKSSVGFAPGRIGTIKNLSGKPKPESAADAGSIAATPAVEAESGENDATTPSGKPAKGKLGKIKNLFGAAR